VIEHRAPRIVVAGLGGDSGKTFLSLGLLLCFRRAGREVAAFKKGPDYIDAAWLSWASGRPARNLDSYLMGFDIAADSFCRHAARGGLNVIEGNRGLYDGVDSAGTHSTAELAKAIQAPVILVVNATKVTRTAAAYVLGCQAMDPALHLAGVVLNQVAGKRHEAILCQAIAETCTGIPVLGVLPRAPGEAVLPGRHLGLVTPSEHPRIAELESNLLRLLEGHIDLDQLASIASAAPALPVPAPSGNPSAGSVGVKIGYVHDSAFTFYYPENLEALEGGGAQLVPVSALSDQALPPGLGALYIGGGFPETHGVALSENVSFLASVRQAAERGLPIYAECGGLMFLSQALHWHGGRYPMAGVLPFEVEVTARPQGHGYAELEVDKDNPFFAPGTRLKGHEFHYSRILAPGAPPPTACSVKRGTGVLAGRDGVVVGRVWASYTHLHALATPKWTNSLLSIAGDFARHCNS
jgi:cobyrinic acid a,c-diamide synthase